MECFDHITESQAAFKQRDKCREEIARLQKLINALLIQSDDFNTSGLREVNLAKGYTESKFSEAVAKWESLRNGVKFRRS